jgi:anti-anti-sigma factor
MAPSDNHETWQSALADGVFDIQTVRTGDALCVLVSGELDLASANELDGAIRLAENTMGREVFVDLTHLRFIDAVGLSVLLEAHTRGQKNDERVRFLPSKYDAVRQLVAVTGASRMFD